MVIIIKLIRPLSFVFSCMTREFWSSEPDKFTKSPSGNQRPENDPIWQKQRHRKLVGEADATKKSGAANCFSVVMIRIPIWLVSNDSLPIWFIARNHKLASCDIFPHSIIVNSVDQLSLDYGLGLEFTSANINLKSWQMKMFLLNKVSLGTL